MLSLTGVPRVRKHYLPYRNLPAAGAPSIHPVPMTTNMYPCAKLNCFGPVSRNAHSTAKDPKEVPKNPNTREHIIMPTGDVHKAYTIVVDPENQILHKALEH